MKQVTEYWLNAIDEYDDTIDIMFSDSLRDAKVQHQVFSSEFPDAHHWELEKVVRWYADDGALKREQVTELKEDWL